MQQRWKGTKMGVTKFDELGRLTLPAEVAQQFGLDESSRLLITVAVTEKRMILSPTEEEPQLVQMQEQMQQHIDKWRYIRALDDQRRVVLPRSMREWLGWAPDTNLKIILDNDAIFLEAASLN